LSRRITTKGISQCILELLGVHQFPGFRLANGQKSAPSQGINF